MENQEKEALQKEIRRLCEEKDAVILAHYYTRPEVQEIADYTGDSFYLAKVAKSDSHKTIVFCGVTFMGESAAILNPQKQVIMPSAQAVCPMALMVSKEDIKKVRETYEDLAVVCYINSMADIKALSDICVTSSNAVKIVRGLPNKNIYFIPDNNLGAFVAEQVPEKNIILNPGYCHVHTSIAESEISSLLKKHPQAKIIAHPECRKDICSLADFLGSTKELIEFVRDDSALEYIVCTEEGVLFNMNKVAPNKKFYFATTSICPNMKRITLDNIKESLLGNGTLALVDDKLRKAAQVPLEKMLEAAKK